MAEKTPIDFIQKHLNRFDIPCLYQFDLYRRTCELVTNKQGLFIEFGLFMGNTAKQIVEYIPKDSFLYGFEGFCGMLNDTTPEAIKGINQLCGELPKYPEQVKVIVGLLEQSLPQFLRWHNEDIAFVNIDVACDSVNYCLSTLAEAKRLKKGTIIVICHAIKLYEGKIYDRIYQAFMEFVNKYNVKFEYIAFGDVHIAIRLLENI